MSTTMTVRIDHNVNRRLEVSADATRRGTSDLAARALGAETDTDTDPNEWQIDEIQAAIDEAEAGDFASDEEVTDLARLWSLNVR